MSLAINATQEAAIQKRICELIAKKSLTGHKGKEFLKALLDQLVDKHRLSRPSNGKKTPPQRLSLVEQVNAKLGRTSTSLNSLAKREARSTQPKTVKSPGVSGVPPATSRQERAHFSEFGANLKSHTFSQAKRTLDLASHRSPGPAHYSYNQSALQPRPAIYIPEDEKVERASFLDGVKDTPCPGHYYPSKHFVSS